ncbi:LPS O-antigen chain length determinant protein WzzB [Pollutimonas harenae]|uniref:LPS O-antigen chain length determinant protein WzzB n=1 Tax=Pollutimonas harenae TaxID=657015 RepID=A0A853GZ38_9BURK|nr:Wzz/FepE/Etk N-terminal domain-containing protein [Pollutimonas harenae]NYT84325.1 LPS O-antigen chain length determinant protein WzzB [Pollutimonas harenae]TEA73273.1 chain-length determining protein [Pollutimonas harenae]
MEQQGQHRNATAPSDEIDLRELLCTLWKAKWLIVATTLVVAGAAAAYTFLSPPIYETRLQTLPPTPSGLASYNMANQLSGPAISGVGINGSDNAVAAITPDDAYNTFLRNLNSVTLRQQFFTKIYLPAHPGSDTPASQDRLWKRFNKELNIKLPQQKDDDELMTLALQGEDPATIADWANRYVQAAITISQKELLETLSSAIQLRLQSTQDQIATLRKVAETTRQDSIARLKEALTLAESIGLSTPPDTGNLITSYTGATTYLRGSKALRAELKLLEQRQSDDPYIEELPNLLKKQSLLQKIDLAPQHVAVATIDQAATVPQEPIKPRKMLILALGIILGGMLGIFTALIRQMFK